MSSVPAQSPLETFTTHSDERVPALMDRYAIPGASIALIREGEIVWIGAYGYADLNAPRPVTPETRFRVQSLTKSVTAWGVLHLVEQGVISLDDPVTQHVTTWEFPETAYDWDDVTIRRLLSHSAGLPSGGHAEVSPIDDMPPLHQALAGDAENPAANPIDVPATGDGIVILTNSERSLQFIADVVGMWTAWRDLPLIALSRAARWMRAPLGVLGALALALAGWLVWDLVTGKLTFAPFAPPARLRRVLLGGFGVLILGLWCGIGYETVRYFLPVFSGWLGIALSAVAGMLTLTSLFPPVE